MTAWSLADAEERAKTPTFQIPSESARKSLHPGDHAKLVFEAEEDLGWGCRGERMWVRITNVLGEGHYVGVLVNHPAVIADAIEHGDAVEFEARHVIDVAHQ